MTLDPLLLFVAAGLLSIYWPCCRISSARQSLEKLALSNNPFR